MATRVTKREIEAMVKRLAQVTKTPYETSYMPQYGGYDLFFRPEGKTCEVSGKYGFYSRKTPKEMYNYLDRLLWKLCP